MSDYDYIAAHGWFDEDRRPPCEFCETEMSYSDNGECCPVCEPRCPLEATPVRASFSIVAGVVRELAL